jgi:hypothetical protein
METLLLLIFLVVQDEKFSFEPKAEKKIFFILIILMKIGYGMITNEGFYVRFGHLIEFIRTNIILKTEGS